MRKLVFWSATALILSGTNLSAQAWEVFPGARVRVSASSVIDVRLIGEVVVSARDSLLIRTSEWQVMTLDPTTVRLLEESHGHNRRTWALVGASGGMIAGALLARAFRDPEPPPNGPYDNLFEVFGAAAAWKIGEAHQEASAVVGGALLGTGAGLVLGIALAPERWRAVFPPYR
jgi:hypothetical protein